MQALPSEGVDFVGANLLVVCFVAPRSVLLIGGTMRSSRSLRVALVVLVLVCVAGVVATARGASSTSKTQAWGLTPGTVGAGALPRVGAAKKLVVDLQGVSATSIDNAPTGISQGDQIAVTGSLLRNGKPREASKPPRLRRGDTERQRLPWEMRLPACVTSLADRSRSSPSPASTTPSR